MGPGPAPEISLPLSFIDDLGRAESVAELRDATSTWLPRIMSVQRGSVCLLAPDRSGLDVFALGAELEIPEHVVMSFDGTIVGQVYQRKTPWRIDNLAEVDKTDAANLRNAGLASSLVVPIIGGAVCYGTLNLAHTDPAHFSDNDTDVLVAIAGMLGSYLRINDQFEREQKLASTDELTGLANRRAVLERAEALLDTDRAQVCLLFIDISGFKAINDAYGHMAGDAVLRAVGERLTGSVRDGDIVGRLGGDEFLVICPGADITAGRRVADRLAERCGQPIPVGGGSVLPRLSIGVAGTGESRTTEALLIEADLAMAKAKRSGSPVVAVDERLKLRAEMIGMIDRDLGPAMRGGHVSFHYQPIRLLATGELVGCEALLRWQHPVHGWIPPPLLMERLEATGALNRFSRWMLETVASDWTALQNRGPDFADLSVAVNLTAAQLAWRSYVNAHNEALVRFGIDRSVIKVEVVESGAIDVGAAAEQSLQELAATGVHIALDDFGTGYNALDYLGRFPVHTLKLDRSLISAMGGDNTARAIVSGIVRMADELGIVTLAEGIETDDELRLCTELGIELGQGYLLGRPMPLAKLLRLPIRG